MLPILRYCAAVITVLANSAESGTYDSNLALGARSGEDLSFTFEIADDFIVDDLVIFLQDRVLEASRRGLSKRINIITKSVRQSSHPKARMSTAGRESLVQAGMLTATSSRESWVQIAMLVILLPLFVILAAYFVLRIIANNQEEEAAKEEKVNNFIDREKGVTVPSKESGKEVVCEKPIGTANRMARLPPTAGPRTQGRLTSPASTYVSSSSGSSPQPSSGSGSRKDKISSQMPTLVEDTPTLIGSHMTYEANEQKRSFPPPLSSRSTATGLGSQVSIDSQASVCSSWYLSHEECQELRNGGSVEVNGSPSFHARLVSKDNVCHLEISLTTSWEAPEATIGPFCWPELSNSEAKIIGPTGEEYGLFAKRGQSFCVSHKSQSDGDDGDVLSDVLTLDPVKTSDGSPVLEVLAGDGMPLGSARLNEEDGDVEIDTDPAVDSVLIVSCVLASFLSNPDIFDASSTKGNPQSDS
jgi:hypothetical protein